LKCKCPCSRSVHTTQNINAVGAALQRSPGNAKRRGATETAITRNSIYQILWLDLHIHVFSYKMSALHKLTAHTQQQRLQLTERGATLRNVRFLDETHFHLHGVVGKQNVCFWTTRNPQAFTEKGHYAAISSHCILHNSFMSQISAAGCQLTYNGLCRIGPYPTQ
jgi:hypothetical protein